MQRIHNKYQDAPELLSINCGFNKLLTYILPKTVLEVWWDSETLHYPAFQHPPNIRSIMIHLTAETSMIDMFSLLFL